MCSGVGKCGSPAPKSTRSAPVARSFSASATTAMVAETWMRLMRSVSILRAGAGRRGWGCGGGSAFGGGGGVGLGVFIPFWLPFWLRFGGASFPPPHGFDLAFRALLDDFGPQPGEGTAEPVDLFHQARAEVR